MVFEVPSIISPIRVPFFPVVLKKKMGPLLMGGLFGSFGTTPSDGSPSNGLFDCAFLPSVVWSLSVNPPDGLAIDVAAGHLYWTNMGSFFRRRPVNFVDCGSLNTPQLVGTGD